MLSSRWRQHAFIFLRNKFSFHKNGIYARNWNRTFNAVQDCSISSPFCPPLSMAAYKICACVSANRRAGILESGTHIHSKPSHRPPSLRQGASRRLSTASQWRMSCGATTHRSYSAKNRRPHTNLSSSHRRHTPGIRPPTCAAC